MPKRRKPAPGGETVKAGHSPWAIIDKDSGQALALFNPKGKAAALRRVAVRIAQQNNLAFSRVKLIPAGLLSQEERMASNVYQAPVVIEHEGDLVEQDISTILSAPATE